MFERFKRKPPPPKLQRGDPLPVPPEMQALGLRIGQIEDVRVGDRLQVEVEVYEVSDVHIFARPTDSMVPWNAGDQHLWTWATTQFHHRGRPVMFQRPTRA